MLEILNASENQKEKFRSTANKLLNKCFLVKKKEDTKRDYYYVKENENDFCALFDLLGYKLNINEDYGVIGIENRNGTGRVNLRKINSIILLILRRLYIEKRKDLSASSEDVVVKMGEINEAYSSLKVKAKLSLDKQTENDFVSLFKRYNLIDNLDRDINMADCRILIYPSILMAVQIEDINSYYNQVCDELEKYKGEENGSSDLTESDEETD